MKDEIKEIINDLQRVADRKCYPEDILDGSIAQEWVDYITNLQEKVNQYENPDDMTLFYMWLDTKAKDKMKHMENEITMLKQQNSVITGMGLDYKSRNEKAIEYGKELRLFDNESLEFEIGTNFINILQGEDKDE